MDWQMNDHRGSYFFSWQGRIFAARDGCCLWWHTVYSIILRNYILLLYGTALSSLRWRSCLFAISGYPGGKKVLWPPTHAFGWIRAAVSLVSTSLTDRRWVPDSTKTHYLSWDSCISVLGFFLADSCPSTSCGAIYYLFLSWNLP